jgi:ribonuclease BN (tRNA processing enzyme)
LQNLRLDFYESGKGETILVTFPSGGMGVIDAHSSKYTHRPDVVDLLKGKKVHFVCLTHPHEDHGLDLVKILEKHPDVEQFWHTLYDIPAFIYGVTQCVNFPSEMRERVATLNSDAGNFFLEILGTVARRDIPPHDLRSDLEPILIDEVEVHCLSPDESVKNEFAKSYRSKLKDPFVRLPDFNCLSAVFALKFGENVVVLGADALRENWKSALEIYFKRKLPKARLIKIPHHGARNALEQKPKSNGYLDICSRTPKAKSVIFAGDSRHPDDGVFQKVRSKTDTFCLSNGRKPNNQANPLQLQIPGARCIYPAPVCNPVVSFELDKQGNISLLAGNGCEVGCLA